MLNFYSNYKKRAATLERITARNRTPQAREEEPKGLSTYLK